MSVRIAYPPAHRLDVADDLHGVRVPDPYRWLEDAASPETAAWSAAQDALARPFLDSLPGRERLRERYRQLLQVGLIAGPFYRGHPDRYFLVRRLGEEELPKLLVHEPDGTERVLIDPIAMDPSGATVLDGWYPSWETDLLAYQVSRGGDEESELRVIEVATGNVVEGPISRTKAGGVSWLPGGKAYYYVRKLPPEAVPPGEEQLHRRVYRHEVGTDPDAADVEVFGDRHGAGWYLTAQVQHPEARWLLIGAQKAGTNRSDLYIQDLAGGDPVITVHEGIEAKSGASVERDGRLYVVTDLDAPRGRLCVADPRQPQPEHWRDLLPESKEGAVLAGVEVLDDLVVASFQRDVITRLQVHDRETGAHLRDIELPGTGTAGAWGRPTGGTDLWFSYTDYATPTLVYHHSLETGETTTWATPPGWERQDAITTEQVFVESRDGTRVPLFLVHSGRQGSGPRPVVLTGYGGFNATNAPAYTASAQAWAEAGGVYAVACLRGGSEYGEEWHRAGRREHKQNVFDDFIACGQWLVDNGWTDPRHLAISGGSNGGLLVGAALTQRPDLFAAVVCSAPLLDMLRYELFGLGSTWNEEYGSVEVPEEFGWLRGYSPYHQVKEGTAYPAVLFTVFESDTRVDPLHARKMCAALQHANTSDAPVLLRRETQVGHGARSLSRSVDLLVDTGAFLASRLGLEV